MRKLWITLLALSTAASVFGAATDPTKTLRLESNDARKAVRLSLHEGDYPLVRCYLYQNGNAWTLDGTETAKLSYSVAGWDEATNMVTVAGTVGANAYVDFQFDSDDTATNGQFYAEIQILDDSPVRAWVWSEVKLEIRKSPIGSAGSLTLDSPPLSTHAALTGAADAHSMSGTVVLAASALQTNETRAVTISGLLTASGGIDTDGADLLTGAGDIDTEGGNILTANLTATGSAAITGLLTASNLTATGTVTATAFAGDGASITAVVHPVGTPVDNQIGVWTGDGTLEGDSDLTWDGLRLDVNSGLGDTAIRLTSTDNKVTLLLEDDTGSATVKNDAGALLLGASVGFSTPPNQVFISHSGVVITNVTAATALHVAGTVTADALVVNGVATNTGVLTASGGIDTTGGNIDLGSGSLDTEGGDVDTGGGDISTGTVPNGGDIDLNGGELDTIGGDIRTSGGHMFTSNLTATGTADITGLLTASGGIDGDGASITNVSDMAGTGRRVWGTGVSVSDIEATAVGAQISGEYTGTPAIGSGADGAHIIGSFAGAPTIGDGAYGARIIGSSSNPTDTATNNGIGAIQLLDLSSGQDALITTGGDGSILLGAGIASNKYSIVAGDGGVSHGDGSITAEGGFYTDSTLTVGDLMCEMDLEDGSTTTLGGAAFVQIANFEANVTDAGYTQTASNITVTVAGRYTVGMSASFFKSDGSGLGSFDCRLYTNGVAVVTASGNSVGWYDTVAAANRSEAVTCRKTLTLAASTVLSWWIAPVTDTNTSITWKSGTTWVEHR